MPHDSIHKASHNIMADKTCVSRDLVFGLKLRFELSHHNTFPHIIMQKTNILPKYIGSGGMYVCMYYEVSDLS